MQIFPIRLLILFASIAFGSHTFAQDTVPEEFKYALGALGALGSYNAQVAVDRAARADISTEKEFRRALRDVLGIQGGLRKANESMENTRKHLDEANSASVKQLIEMNAAVIEEIDAIVSLLKARKEGSGTSMAQASYHNKRAVAIKRLGAMGFSEDLFE